MTVIANTPDPTSADFFEQKYRSSDDPWDFAGSAYETRRYDATLAALAGRRFRHAFEPACSVGVLTERLSTQCDYLLATDLSPTAVERARSRCRHLPNVEFRRQALTADSTPADLDLLVLSEIGYYFDTAAWSTLAVELAAHLIPGGTLLAVHWLGHSPDHLTSGDDVHEALARIPSLRLDHTERHEEPAPTAGFRLERFTRA